MENSTRLSWKIALFSLVMTFAFMISGNAYAQLAGGTTYPVNGTSNVPTTFASLSEAATYLRTNGVSGTGQVLLELQTGYTGTNDSVTFRNITGLSATLGIMIRPASDFDAVTYASSTAGPNFVIRLAGVSYFTLDGRKGGAGTTPSWVISSRGTNGRYAITQDNTWGAMTGNTIQYCILEGEQSGTSGGTYGTQGGANLFTNNKFEYNIIRNYSSTLRGYGITYANLTNTGNTGNTIKYNEIYNFTARGINLTGTFSGLDVSFNKIYNILTPTITATFYGIYYSTSTATGTVINGNTIRTLKGTAPTEVTGIYFFNGNTAGTPTTVSNNIIILEDSISTSTGPVYGIRDNALSTSLFNIYHNSVWIGGTPASGASNSAAFRKEVSGSINLKNNIFFNARSNGGTATGIHWAISANNTTFASINNNDYYATGTGGVLGTTTGAVGGNQTTIAGWKSVVTADVNSIAANPHYISIANLHIDTLATQVESGGATGTGITTDIDGDVRNATPDIGADEGTFKLLDLSGPSITYTVFANTTGTTNRTLSNVTITDVSGIAGDPNRPRLYFKKSTDASWVSVAANETSSPYTFTTDYTLVGGGAVSVGDVIQYFVIAQDVPGNVVANPGTGLVATDVNTVTSYPTTPNQYTILGTISGTKTVGTTGDYATLQAAIADLNAKELVGPLTFSLIDASYTIDSLEINVNTGSSATNTVTIKPAVGVTATITGAVSNSYLIKLKGISYLTIDGSNAVGGTTRDLTITNTSVTAPRVLLIGSIGTAITGNTVKNCNIVNGANTATAVTVGKTDGTAGLFTNITIQNNSVKKAYIGIYAIATVAAGNGNGLLISGNDMSASGTDAIRLMGVYVQGVDGATVSNNSIGNFTTSDASNITGIWFATSTVNSIISGNTIGPISSTTGAPRGIVVSSATNANVNISGNIVTGITTSYSGAPYGIYVLSTTTGVIIEKNKVDNVSNTNASGYGARGIHINTGVASSNIILKNNFVWNITATADASSTYWVIGMGIEGATGGVNVYNNSVNLYGNFVGYTSGTVSAAFAVLTSTATTLNVRNNIFVNTYDNTNSSTDKAYAINSQAANTAFTDINYNNYYVSGTPGILGYLGTDQATLIAWQTATTKDANSVSGNPGFVSAADLHIDVYNPSPVGNAGTPLAGIVDDDIDGNARSATTPDIGADEYVGVTPAAFVLLTPGNESSDQPINGSLVWQKSTYATSYDVYLDNWAVNPPTTLIGNTTDTTFAYSATPIDTFVWRVVAKNGNGTTNCTADFAFATGANPPAAPSGLTFDVIMIDTVKMSWTDNATDETGFRVYRSTELNGTYTNVSGDLDSIPGSGSTGSYNDGGLASNTKYYYKVVSFDLVSGNSEADLDSVVTKALVPGAPTFANVAYTSVNVIVNQNGNSSVTQYAIRIADGPTEDVDYYIQADGSVGTIAVWQTYAQWGGVSGKKVTGLSVNSSYDFDVNARNLDAIETGFGAVGNVITLAPLAMPFVEDFTSTTYPPVGWSRKGTVIGSRLTAVQPNGTSGGALKFSFWDVSSGSDTLITPLINVTGTGVIVLRFSHAYKQYDATSADRFRVLLSNDDGATWDTTLFDKQGAALATLPLATPAFTPGASSDWKNNLIFINPSRYSNTTRLMLIATTDYGNNLWIDDIKLMELPGLDYALTGIKMVNGIPNPFILKTEDNNGKRVDGEMLSNEKGVEGSNVNNSALIKTTKGYTGKVKTVANNGDLTEMNIDATRSLTMSFDVSNFGLDTTALFDLAWDIEGASQTGHSSTTGISFDSKKTVEIGATFDQLGTYTTNASITVAGDEDLTNNSLSFYRTLVYPEPMVRIHYDNGTNVQSTFIGANGPPFLAGVRYTATADMHLTNIDALYANGTSIDSILVQVWAAGATNNVPGALLFSKKFGGDNYISAGGDYMTLPLGEEAPSFMNGTNFWVSIRFANVPYPMGAHNTGFTTGRSFYSMDEGATWNPLVITTERAWLMRVVGVQLNPPTAVNLLEPADETLITVDGSSTEDATLLWSSSTDADGDPVTYTFWASLNSDFSDSVVYPNGSDTSLTIAYSDIDALLAAWDVADGDTAHIYWKVISADGMFETPSVETFMLNVYRYMFIPTKGWTLQTSGFVGGLYSVKAVSQTIAWAAGEGGAVLRTVNGGTTWANVGGGAIGANDVLNITALDENTAFVTTTPSSSKIFRTLDGGTTWTEVFDQVGGFIDAIHMFDATNGIAYGDPVGGTWTILNTTDGGATWYRIATEPAQVGGEAGWSNALVAVGNTHIWFGTGSNRVYYTTDGGLTWASGATAFANSSDLHFLNDGTTGVVGGGPTAARSTNGGANWTSVTPIPGTGNIYGVDGAGTHDFWLSRGSTIDRSKNQGATWATEFTVTGTVYGMSFVNYAPYTSGWVVTSTGVIASFFDSTTVIGVDDPIDNTPNSFALYQNYPNPFNPTTTIKYDLKENAKVTLKIYNLLGQEVRTLVNTKQNAGTFTLNWDGKNNAGLQVSTGVYIYRIQAGNFVKSHKMMLIK